MKIFLHFTFGISLFGIFKCADVRLHVYVCLRIYMRANEEHFCKVIIKVMLTTIHSDLSSKELQLPVLFINLVLKDKQYNTSNIIVDEMWLIYTIQKCIEKQGMKKTMMSIYLY